MLTTVPFSGFYNSLHDAQLDQALEQMFSDRATGCQVNSRLFNEAFSAVDWGFVHVSYAWAYVDAFAEEFKVSLSFESLRSPKEYNFTTDRIFAEISEDEVRRIFSEADKSLLTAITKEQFTSRSGFISFYSPDWRTWGDVLEWDHNQVGALLQALVGDEFDQWAEFSLMSSAYENGRMESWLSEGEKVQRLLRIHDRIQREAA